MSAHIGPMYGWRDGQLRDVREREQPLFRGVTGACRPAARVVFVPGIMGSALTDPTAPRDTCRRVLRDGRLGRLVGLLLNVMPPAFGGAFREALCRLDPTEVWGANGMVLWALDADQWEPRLSSGDGYRRGGQLVTRPGRRGLFRISLAGYQVDPYGSFLMYLDRYTQMMRISRQRALDMLVFPYDWRLDGTLNAQLLGEAIRRRWWPRGVPSEVAQDDRVLIFAHSMGGLLARY